MNEGDKIRGWLAHLQQKAVQGTERMLSAYDSMTAGTYEPKQALADWSFFATLGWLSVLPEAPTAAAGGETPIVSVRVHQGQATAAGWRPIPRAPQQGVALAAALALTTDASVTIATGRFTVELFDGQTSVLVKADGLDAAGLKAGQKYTGEIRAGAAKIANVELVVLGAL